MPTMWLAYQDRFRRHDNRLVEDWDAYQTQTPQSSPQKLWMTCDFRPTWTCNDKKEQSPPKFWLQVLLRSQCEASVFAGRGINSFPRT